MRDLCIRRGEDTVQRKSGGGGGGLSNILLWEEVRINRLAIPQVDATGTTYHVF